MQTRILLLPLSLLRLLTSATLGSPQQQQVLQQPGSTDPVDCPYRPLPWGDVNILSTTDTHGWLLGHQVKESSYSGDWGDLLSFVTRLKEEAIRRNVDFLLVDSGDRVDGNGLVDAEPPSHVKGFVPFSSLRFPATLILILPRSHSYTALKYFKNLPYDLITTGNHELYKYPVALNTYNELYKKGYGENYVTSNVEIEINGTWKSFGEKFRKFETLRGRKVTAFGPLFYFRANDKGLRIVPPHLMVSEPWFKAAVASPPDFFLLAGHMSIQSELDSEWTIIFQAIRKVHPKIPILIFGGHHHIRDCKMEDERSMSLAAGRYMETLGWMSVSGIDEDDSRPLNFSRRYLDQNRNTYAYHAGKDFDTKEGVELSQAMTATADSFNLTQSFGTAPHCALPLLPLDPPSSLTQISFPNARAAYYLARYPSTHEYSLLNLMTSKVLPRMLRRPDREKKGTKSFTILNSGSIRFDIFKGDFTRNSQWIILPFTNNFVYIPSIPYSVASRLLKYLNLVGEHGTGLHPYSSEESYREQQISSYESYLATSNVAEEGDLTWGYVTKDKCEGLGDDTMHKPLPSVRQPTFVASDLPVLEFEEDDPPIDVVFFDFIRPDIISALNYLQKKKVFTIGDVERFLEEGNDLTANTLMQEYAKLEWN